MEWYCWSWIICESLLLGFAVRDCIAEARLSNGYLIEWAIMLILWPMWLVAFFIFIVGVGFLNVIEWIGKLIKKR